MPKICVYSIALNEEQFAERWAKSAIDADYMVVGDTGSTDKTVEKLSSNGVLVYNLSIKPFRFDVARNTVLSLIPSDVDICVSLDLDEYLIDGWRQKLENSWLPNTTRAHCTRAYMIDVDPTRQEWCDYKIHSRYGYVWKRPVHESLTYCGDLTENRINVGHIMNHSQDYNKSRSLYTPLLKLSLDENPDNHEICDWYARALRDENNPECVSYFKRYLAMPAATWNAERAETMRSIAKFEDTEGWLKRSISECKDYKPSWLDLARYYYGKADWVNCLQASISGLNCDYNAVSNTFLTIHWPYGPELDDFAAISYWNLGAKEKSLEHAEKALIFSPNDERLQNNLKLIRDSLDSN
jgi:glycosyltransferase involved in cell wall biosynthesis